MTEFEQKRHESKMQEIADKIDCVTFDGGDDNRLFYDDEMRIDVYAPAIGYNTYRTMEKRIREFSIKREKYTVYAWNDCSGWKYWKDEGGCNYIQITASINDVNLTDDEVRQLENDLDYAYNEFCEYHTINEYCQSLNEREKA